MASEFSHNTHGADVPGMPRLLQKIWAHVHPNTPAPVYTVCQSRHPDRYGFFKASVVLQLSAIRHNSVAFTFESEPTTRARQAIQDTALRAISGIRNRDPEMATHRRYAFYPRLMNRHGACVFAVCQDEEDPALSHFARYVTLLT